MSTLTTTTTFTIRWTSRTRRKRSCRSRPWRALDTLEIRRRRSGQQVEPCHYGYRRAVLSTKMAVYPESSRPSKASNGPRNEERSRQASKEKARSSSVPRIVVETCEESSTSAAPRQEGPSPLLVPAAPSPSRGSMVSLAESSLDGESKPRRSIRRKVQEEDPLTLRLKQMDNENVWSDYRRQLKRHIRDLPDSSKSRAKQQLLGQRVTGTSKDKARLEHLKARDKEEHRELVHHVEAELRACARSRYKVLRMQEVLKRRLRPKVDFGGVAGLLA
ncbi:unnamed protein product [Effrenium voratum]|nr:unnamed protein product [Effrenium voratum]